ncbi:hypothetical protein C7M84_017963 [Penaeus vannamei]|uniref:Uncharacterized protein n=1 Tax=Penaeus vannamei TaxID=6689 RepID=A0A423SIL9_PENVA|nr:hypothetical protein C7M84_017963 [Penaeus vannamei]
MGQSAELASPFPPINLCPWPSFHPLRLTSLGLNTSVATGDQLMLNVENLTGIDRGMTGRKLVEEAAWRLEELVEELEVGNTQQIYNESNVSSQFWQRSFSPTGPCLTLTPPPLASLQSRSLTLKLRQRHSDWDECTWTDEGIPKRYSGPQDCSAVHEHCNRSCVWEQFITQHFYRINFIYLQSSSLTLDIPHASSDLRLSKSQVEAVLYEVIHLDGAEIGSRDCLQRCLTETSEATSKCIKLSEATQKKQIRDLCITQSQQYSLLEKILLDSNVIELFSTSLSIRPLQARDLPAVTVCIWPPFNVQRLLETAGLGSAYEQVTHLDPVDKHASILSLLQRLIEAPNGTTLDHLWSESAWKANELEFLWSGLHGDTTGRGKCMSACLEKALQDQMGCILPWAIARYDLPVCNMNHFADFVAGLWNLGLGPRDVYSAVLGKRVTHTCSRRCHQRLGVFFGISSGDERHVAQTLTFGYLPKKCVTYISSMLAFHSENFESVIEHDRYPLSQLLCEIGGIAGMTLGTSLASVMEGIVAAF